MKQFADIKWQATYLHELFSFDKGNQNNMAALCDGNIPLVSAKKCDNGYKSFISDNGKRLYEGHCLTLNNDGDGGAGLAYYQPTKMALDSHVTALVPKVEMSKHSMLFIARCISKQRSLFGHGRSINASRLRTFRLMLPVTESGQPDYDFMEAYMKAVEKRLLTQYKDYLASVHGSDLNGGGKIGETRWKAFFIEEVCDIFSGQDIYKLERIPGNMPYITATAEQNGIGYFVGNNNKTLERDCISVNRNGSVGYAFYHPYLALYGNDTRKLSPKFKKGNKYVSIFLAMAITAQKDKYGYGLKMGTGRLRRQKIILPSKLDGQPDFDYMEAYMRKKEEELLLQYINLRLTA